MKYKLIKSKRKTIAIEVRGGEVIVRAPRRITKREADIFAHKHEAWVQKQLQKQRRAEAELDELGRLSADEIALLYERAREYIPERVRHYAAMLGEDYGRITIRCQRGRWGSCSAKRSLNFNCLLMLAPPQVIDSVAAHEVCHLREMNHSERFYELLGQLCPDYSECDRWLKENGSLLLARARPDPERTPE